VRFIGQTHTSLGATGHVQAADSAHRAIVAELRALHRAPITRTAETPVGS